MKCINCGTYLENKPSFCPNCGNKVNKMLYIRIIVLGLIATILPFIFLRGEEDKDSIVYLYIFGSYLICTIIVELTLRVFTRKEGIVSSIFGPLLQCALMMILSFFEISAKGEVAGLVPLAILILELPYIPLLFIINMVTNLIFCRVKKKPQ